MTPTGAAPARPRRRTCQSSAPTAASGVVASRRACESRRQDRSSSSRAVTSSIVTISHHARVGLQRRDRHALLHPIEMRGRRPRGAGDQVVVERGRQHARGAGRRATSAKQSRTDRAAQPAPSRAAGGPHGRLGNAGGVGEPRRSSCGRTRSTIGRQDPDPGGMSCGRCQRPRPFAVPGAVLERLAP